MNYIPLKSNRIPLPTARSNSQSSPPPLNNVEQKLATLALRLEKELQNEATVKEYYGQCGKCGKSVIDSLNACQAMGQIYHNNCFTCSICHQTLSNKTFYRVRDQVYCEEDYLVKIIFYQHDFRFQFFLHGLVHWISTDDRKMFSLSSFNCR